MNNMVEEITQEDHKDGSDSSQSPNKWFHEAPQSNGGDSHGNFF